MFQNYCSTGAKLDKDDCYSRTLSQNYNYRTLQFVATIHQKISQNKSGLGC